MRIYAIGDLHLPGHAQKPMNVFGSQWDRHFELITQNWRALTPEDEKILARECLRLRLSLQAAMRLMDGQTQLNVMTHYPPLLSDGADTPLTEVLREYPVCRVVYGHLHGAGIKGAFQGEREGISYHLTSCDALGFCPKCILA